MTRTALGAFFFAKLLEKVPYEGRTQFARAGPVKAVRPYYKSKVRKTYTSYAKARFFSY